MSSADIVSRPVKFTYGAEAVLERERYVVEGPSSDRPLLDPTVCLIPGDESVFFCFGGEIEID